MLRQLRWRLVGAQIAVVLVGVIVLAVAAQLSLRAVPARIIATLTASMPGLDPDQVAAAATAITAGLHGILWRSLAVAALVGVGMTYMFVFSGIGTVVQLRAPAALRGRVLSFYFLALGVLYPIGATLQGPLADRVGMGVVTALSGVVMVVVLGVVRVVSPGRFSALDDPIEA